MKIQHFFDKDTYTLSYVVYDEQSRDALVIDAVLNYDPAASKVSQESLSELREFIKNEGLALRYILETHAHADHLSGAQFLKQYFPTAQIGIGARIREVQQQFKGVFNYKEFNESAVPFDVLLEDNSVIELGSLSVKTLFTPGHTPACVSYLINDEAVFTGDALFMDDYGTGRCDFPGGSSRDLYQSVMHRLYSLSDEVRVYVGHDYLPGGRELRFSTTIGEEKAKNIRLNMTVSEAQFVSDRDGRDATLTAPRLLLQSLQVNIEGGHLPVAEDNGVSYLKMPIKGL